jgi:hypothetical protein
MLPFLLKTTPDVIVFKDAQGDWRMASDSALRLFRLEGKPFQGLDDAELGDLVPFFREAFAFCLQTDEATWQAGTRCVHLEVVPQPDAPDVLLETIKTPIFHADGSRAGILLVGRDVTERQRMAQEVIRRTVALEKAKELNRLKNDFVNTVSHELRTPITTIVGYAEFLEDGLDGALNAGQLQSVKLIQRSTERLAGLVDDLLDFARIEAGAFKLAVQRDDLSAVVTEVRDALFPQAHDKRITIEAEVPPEPFQARFDRKRISQVLLNLAGNAIKFTPEGGRVTIRLSHNPIDARVEVIDTGPGISPDHLSHLFEKFYQVESSLTRAKGGAGLGLSIAKALVEAHDGRIGVESAPGQGAIFWFTLPLLAEGPHDPQP